MAVAWSDSAASLDAYASERGMEWVFGEGQADLARDYSVRAQSSWVGITGDGTLAERGSGHQSEEGWRETLTELGATSIAG